MPKSAKLVVLATEDLAIPVLEAAIEAGHELALIVGRPPREPERGELPEERQGEALEEWAAERKVAMIRPDDAGGERVRGRLAELEPDLGLVVAFGADAPTSLLEVPKRGWIKVHFSLLPKYRGRHPIRATLWHGERQAGATVIQVTDEPDAGPILLQERFSIEPHETFGELAPRVAAQGAEMLAPAILAALTTKPKVRKQTEKNAIGTPDFGMRHRRAPWWRSADVVYARLRALSPEPGMTTLMSGQRVRILNGKPASYINPPIGDAGTFLGLRAGRIAILCGNGTVFAIDQVQTRSGASTSAASFSRKSRLHIGESLV